VPDVVAAHEGGVPVALRHPQGVRPWQHVLDPIAGYLMLAQALIDNPAGAPPALNFGPEADGVRSVRELVEALSRRWGGRPSWQPDPGEHPHEAPLLRLDASRAQARLGWRPQLAFEDAVAWTADWYRAFWNGADVAEVTLRQIETYAARLKQSPSDVLHRAGSANSVDSLPHGISARPDTESNGASRARPTCDGGGQGRAKAVAGDRSTTATNPTPNSSPQGGGGASESVAPLYGDKERA
jgi:hypothetical protein